MKVVKRKGTKFIGGFKGDAFVAMCEWKGRMYMTTTGGVYVVENDKLRLVVTSQQLGTLKMGEKKSFE